MNLEKIKKCLNCQCEIHAQDHHYKSNNTGEWLCENCGEEFLCLTDLGLAWGEDVPHEEYLLDDWISDIEFFTEINEKWNLHHTTTKHTP